VPARSAPPWSIEENRRLRVIQGTNCVGSYLSLARKSPAGILPARVSSGGCPKDLEWPRQGCYSGATGQVRRSGEDRTRRWSKR
jgi:hypothetical protein